MKKMVLRILLIVIAVIIVIGIGGTVANKNTLKKTLEYISAIGAAEAPTDLQVELDEEGFYTITADRDLKILQLTDIHIGGSFGLNKSDLQSVNAVAAMVKAEKPDLVVVTGDISFPSPFRLSCFNNQYASTIFASLMTELDVYWTLTFGNHDAEDYSIYDRKEMAEFYSSEEWTKCLFQMGDEDLEGFGNSVIKVKNSDGVITQALFTIDTNDYEGPLGTGGYANIDRTQIDWYKATCEKLDAENKTFIENGFDGDKKVELQEKFGSVKSLVFLHIPPVEYEYAWNEFSENGYKDTENVKYYYGTLGENVCHPENDDDFFETVLDCNSTKGIFCGHDHINNFSLDYKGVRLTYGMSVDFAAYRGIDKLGTQRGCTVITLKNDGSFDCYPENYYQDKYESPDKESVTMQKLNEEFN